MDLIHKLFQAEKELGFDSKQFSGAVAVSLVKEVIESAGLQTSEKDVFIKGVPIEIDLLLVRPGGKPEYGVLWNPEDVIAAFEIKKSGIITGTIKTNSDFHRINTYCPDISLFYVSISEDQNRIREIERSDRSFVFFKRHKGKYSSTGDFEKFIQMLEFLREEPLKFQNLNQAT